MAAPTLIPDASVGAKWVLDEPDSAQARALQELYLQEEVAFAVPTLFFYELANVLRFTKARPAGTEADDLLEAVYDLEIEAVDPTREQLTRAIAESKRLKGSVYDAVYLVLAKERNGAMVTADEDFDRRARSRHVTTLAKAVREFAR